MPKASTKAQKSFKSSRLRASNLFTPVRRLFFKLNRFKPGNRQRVRDQETFHYGDPEPDPVVDTPPESPAAEDDTISVSRASVSHGRPCMALQNEDSAEDAIVITTLSALPFCCHEDLFTMPRNGLVGVAESLNTKLPAVLRISTNPARTDAAIRHEIEFVVGLRKEMVVPPAPRAQRPNKRDRRYVMEVDVNEEMDRTPPTSPLARRGRRILQMYGTPGTPRLQRLMEEQEEEEERPGKRQKTESTVQEVDDSMDVDGVATPTPVLTRARGVRSRSVQMPASSTPRPPVLRSHSTKLPAEMADITIDTAFINMKRPKYRKRENRDNVDRRRATQPALIRRPSAPQQKARAASTVAACRPFLAFPGESTSTSSSTSQSSTEMPSSSSDSCRVGMRRRRNSIEAEKGMAGGIKAMNMHSETDMLE